MERRKFLFSMGFGLSGLVGCAGRPAPIPPRPAHPSNAPAFDSIDSLLAADPDPRRTELVMMALSFIGIPYILGGTTPERGFDCSGLIAHVYRRTLNQILPRTTWEQSRIGEPIAVPALRAGDLLFYNTLGRRNSHVALYIGQARFIHAPATGGVVSIAAMATEYWVPRFDGARKVLT